VSDDEEEEKSKEKNEKKKTKRYRQKTRGRKSERRRRRTHPVSVYGLAGCNTVAAAWLALVITCGVRETERELERSLEK
jgi:hypothetical protein